jgi:hypothetical protein
MSDSIDWEHLARSLGLLREGGEVSGNGEALRALELIIGEKALLESVEYYIAGGPGSELARSVLWQLRSWGAMNHCYEIFKSSRPLDERRMAVELVRVVADNRALPWVDEFLKDPDAGIQLWGAGLLDQLLWSELIEPTAAEPQLRIAEVHDNEGVVERARFIRDFLQSRADIGTLPGEA